MRIMLNAHNVAGREPDEDYFRTRIYICTRIFADVYAHVRVYTHMYVYIRTCTCIYAHIRVYTHIYVI